MVAAAVSTLRIYSPYLDQPTGSADKTVLLASDRIGLNTWVRSDPTRLAQLLRSMAMTITGSAQASTASRTMAAIICFDFAR